MLEHLITTLCSDLGIPYQLEKNLNGYYSVQLNQDTELLMRELDPGFVCRSVITTLPPQKQEHLFTLAMKANFLGQGTQGGAISIDEQLKSFWLTLAIPEETNNRLFKEHIETFVNYLYYWKTRLEKEKNI